MSSPLAARTASSRRWRRQPDRELIGATSDPPPSSKDGERYAPRMPTSTSPFIVDADSHWSEPPDLFTKMAPAEYKDRVPHVEVVDGERTWVFDGAPDRAGSAPAAVIDRDGVKEEANIALFEWEHEMIHVGAWDPEVRLAGHRRVRHRRAGDLPEHGRPRRPGPRHGRPTTHLRHLVIEIYNDAHGRDAGRARATGSCRCRSCRRGASILRPRGPARRGDRARAA